MRSPAPFVVIEGLSWVGELVYLLIWIYLLYFPGKAVVNEQGRESPSPETVPGEESGPEAPVDEEVQAQVERLIARAAKVGAWGQAEEYCRSRFKGPHLAYALEELRIAKDEAQSKKTERKAA